MLEARFTPQLLNEIGIAESSGLNFIVYDCVAAKGRPYHVIWAHQCFEDQFGYWTGSILYYLIAPGKLNAREGSVKIAHKHQLDDWIVRELHWREQPLEAEDEEPVSWSWYPCDGYTR